MSFSVANALRISQGYLFFSSVVNKDPLAICIPNILITVLEHGAFVWENPDR